MEKKGSTVAATGEAPGSAESPGLPRLGEMLRFLGLVTAGDIEGSLRRQSLEGGRLGSCLLDSGLVDEDTLLAVLGTQLRVATADAAMLAAVPLEAVKLLPARAAILAGAVPLARSGRTLEVAMTEPTSMSPLDSRSPSVKPSNLRGR